MKIRTLIYLAMCAALALTSRAAEIPEPDAVSSAMSLLPAEWQAFLGAIIFAIGLLHSVVPPLTAAAHAIARATNTPADDEALARLENSAFWKALATAINWASGFKPYRGPATPALSNQNAPVTETRPSPAPSSLGLAGSASATAAMAMAGILGLFALVGIGLTGCATRLQTGGAYAPATTVVENGSTNLVAVSAPDLEFFLVDSSFSALQAVTDATFETERSNRAFLWSVSPKIKHTLDEWRPIAKQAVKDYALARRAYMAHPTPAGLATLQTVFGRLQQVADAVQAAMPKKGN